MEIKCQLDATDVFVADLIACSTCFRHHYAHHQELKSIIQWLLPVVFHAVNTITPYKWDTWPTDQAIHYKKTYQEHPHTAPTTFDTPSNQPRQHTTLKNENTNSTKTYKIIFYIFTAWNTTGSNHCIILLSSWWWA